MKQLYTIGILVAILILVLLGLNKLNNPTNATPPAAHVPETDVSTTEPTIERDVTNDNTTAMTDDITIPTENTTVVMKTNMGDITIELFLAESPITAGNFYKLAASDFYDGTKFHRVIDDFMIQGGDPLSKDDSLAGQWGTGGPGYKIQDEFIEGLSNVRGTLSMANSGPNSGGSQFFINTIDNSRLDWYQGDPRSKHPVFGRVVDGMDVVDAISKVPAPDTRPAEPVIIEDIVVN